MRKFGLLVTLALMALVASCASEAPEIQKYYTDAKTMWDEVNKAFTLPKGDERMAAMNKFIMEKWDKKIVENLSQYLQQAPSGKYASDAKKLLEEARNSQALKAFEQARPLLENAALPKTAEEADSLAAKWQREQKAAADSAAAMAPAGQ